MFEFVPKIGRTFPLRLKAVNIFKSGLAGPGSNFKNKNSRTNFILIAMKLKIKLHLTAILTVRKISFSLEKVLLHFYYDVCLLVWDSYK